MHTLTDWRAKRAGGRITVYGKGPTGSEEKVVGVDEIIAAKPHPIATDKDGRQFALA